MSPNCADVQFTDPGHLHGHQSEVRAGHDISDIITMNRAKAPHLLLLSLLLSHTPDQCIVLWIHLLQ